MKANAMTINRSIYKVEMSKQTLHVSGWPRVNQQLYITLYCITNRIHCADNGGC